MRLTSCASASVLGLFVALTTHSLSVPTDMSADAAVGAQGQWGLWGSAAKPSGSRSEGAGWHHRALWQRMMLRGGSDDVRSRRRLVKGKRSIDVPSGFFGKPVSSTGSGEHQPSAVGAPGGTSETSGTGPGASSHKGSGNPFAPSSNPFAAASASSVFGPAAGGVGRGPGSPFGPANGDNSFSAQLGAPTGSNPFAPPAAGIVHSPFGTQTATPATQPNLGAASSGVPSFGFSGSSAIGAPGETSRPSSGNPFNPFPATSSSASQAASPFGSSHGQGLDAKNSQLSGKTGGGSNLGGVFAGMREESLSFANATGFGQSGFSSPLLGSPFGGGASLGSAGRAGSDGGVFNISSAAASPFQLPSSQQQQQQQQQQQPVQGMQGPVAVPRNPFQDITSLRRGAVDNGATSVQPAAPLWELSPTRLNVSSDPAAGSSPFGASIAHKISAGEGFSGARIERGKPIFNLSGAQSFGISPHVAAPAGTSTGEEQSTVEYTGIIGEGGVHRGEFLGLAKGGVANFGFIKPADAAGGAGGGGNIFVHKSNIKMGRAGDAELSAGQRVRYRLAPHEAPSSFGGMPSAQRVQAVEVEADDGGVDEQGQAGGQGAALSGGVKDGEWRCGVCMVTNKAESAKCVCCEAAPPPKEEPVARVEGADGGVKSAPLTFGSQGSAPLFGNLQAHGSSSPMDSNRTKLESEPGVQGSLKTVGEAGRRRLREEAEGEQDELWSDAPASKAHRSQGNVVSSDASRDGQDSARVPSVLGSPRLLGYSCLVTDLEAATTFLQEVAGMQVRGHENYFQTLEGGLGFNGQIDAPDWSKTLLACPDASDVSLTLELVHVRALASHVIEADLTELVLASTPTLRRLRQQRSEWEARGWVPLETQSGLVLRVPGTAIAIKVVPSKEGRASWSSSAVEPGAGRGKVSGMTSEIVSLAVPSHDLEAARVFYEQALGMQVAVGGQVPGGQVALSFGSLGPRLLLVACPSKGFEGSKASGRRLAADSTLPQARKQDTLQNGFESGDLGFSPRRQTALGGIEGGAARQAPEQLGANGVGDGLGVPASTGRLVIGCTKPVMHALSARVTVGGHVSLVPLSSFPGPRRTRLALTLLKSPDGHEVVAVEKDALLALLSPRADAQDLLQDTLDALEEAAAAAAAAVSSTSQNSPRMSIEGAADPPIETPPRFIIGSAGSDKAGATDQSSRHGADSRAGEPEGLGRGVGVRMYSRVPPTAGDRTKLATGQAARAALSCTPQGVSGALLHARYAVEWQASGYFVDGIESHGHGLHVVWRHQSGMADSREWASDPDASSFVNGHCEHDIEAVDYVQIEGVESVLQVERDVNLEDYEANGSTQDCGVFLAVNDAQGRALLQSLVEGLQESPELLNHRRILLPRPVYSY